MEDAEVQEQQPAQNVQPPKQKLWQSLNNSGFYTKSYDEFDKQFSTPDKISKLYTTLNQSGYYTKGADDFNNQFFAPEKKNPDGTPAHDFSHGYKPAPQDLKDKQSWADLMSGLEKSGTGSNSSPNTNIPSVNFHTDKAASDALNASFKTMRAKQTQKSKLDDPGSEYYVNLAKQREAYEKENPGSWANTMPILTHAITQMVTKPLAGMAKIERDLIGKTDSKTTASKPLYDEKGELTEYGKQVDKGKQSDVLGKLVIGLDAYNKQTDKEDAHAPLPHTVLGNTAQGIIGIAPDVVTTFALPEERAGASLLEHFAFNPFNKVLATKGGLNAYSQAEQEGKTPGDAAVEGAKGAGKAELEATIMNAIGGVSEKFVAQPLLKQLEKSGVIENNMLTRKGISAISNAAVGSLYPITKDLVQGKPVNWDEVEQTAGTFFTFGLMGGDDHPDKSSETRQAIAVQNFMNAAPEAIKAAHELPTPAADINAQAIDHAAQYEETKEPQHAAAASTLTKTADVKATTEAILKAKDDFIKSIGQSNLPDDAKAQVIAKINDIHKMLDPVEQQKSGLDEKIQELDSAIANNEQREATTPSEIADKEVVGERLTKEREGLANDLKKTISKQYEDKTKLITDEQEPDDTPAAKLLSEKSPADESGKPEGNSEAPAEEPETDKIGDISDAIDKKAEELAKVDTSPKKLKEQKKDILDQMQEVHQLLNGETDADALKKVKDAGYEVSDDGKVTFDVKDDGIFKVHHDNLIDGSAIDQVKKEFPERLEKSNSKTDFKGARASENKTAENRTSLKETADKLQDAKDNLEAANKVGNTRMAKVWQEEVDREQRIHDIAKNIEYKPVEAIEPTAEAISPGEPPKTDEPRADKTTLKSELDDINKKLDESDIDPKKYIPASEKNKLLNRRDELNKELGNKHEKVIETADLMPKVVKIFVEHDVLPIAQKLGTTAKEVYNFMVKGIAPKIGVDRKALNIVMTKLGGENEAKAEFDKAWNGLEKMFDKMKDPERIAFIDALKRGTKQGFTEMKDTNYVEMGDIADMYRQADKNLYNELKKVFPNLTELDNHYRVLWKTLPGAEGKSERKWWGISRRPLSGSKGFLKMHTLADMSEGIERGGVPVSTNPITMFKMAYADAQKAITAKNMFEGLKDGGFVKFVKEGGEVPDGFTKIDDKIAKIYFPVKTESGGTVIQKAGEWYIEENAGRIVNNHLSRDYIREAKLGEGLMNLKNLYTGVELSLSGFHASAIALEGMSSDIGLGYRKMINLGLRGDWKSAVSGMGDILKSPFSPKTTFSLGKSFIKLATEKDFESSDFGKKLLKRMPNAQEYLHDFFMGGGLVKQSTDLKANTYKALKDNISKENYIGAAIRSVPVMNELIMSPLFDTYIPAMKIGVFMKEFPVALKEQEARIASGKTSREEVARKVVDLVDNRMGETNFDNLFWNRTFKSANQLNFRSITWKLGNVKAMGGAVPEQVMEFVNAAKEKRAPLLMPKMAWVAGLATMQAVLAEVTQRSFTGTNISSFKDFIAPRTDKDDDKKRLFLPTYIKDVAALGYNTGIHWYSGLGNYISGSLSGTTGAFYDIIANKDFQNYQIYDHRDDVLTQLGDIAKYIEPEPIGVQNFLKDRKNDEPWIKTGFSLIGINNAPKYLTNPPVDNKIFDLYNIQEGVRTKGEKETNELKAQIRGLYKKGNGADADKLIDNGIESGRIKISDIKYLFPTGKDAEDPAVFIFSKLKDNDDKIWLYNQMTDEEKQEFDPNGKMAVMADKKAEQERETKKKSKPYSILP